MREVRQHAACCRFVGTFDGFFNLLDGRTLSHLCRQLLDELHAGGVVNELFRIVRQQEVAELVVNVSFGSLEDDIGKTLVELVDVSHTLLLFCLADGVAIDMLGNAVDFLANHHH